MIMLSLSPLSANTKLVEGCSALAAIPFAIMAEKQQNPKTAGLLHFVAASLNIVNKGLYFYNKLPKELYNQDKG